MTTKTASTIPDLATLPADAAVDAEAVAAILSCSVRHVHRMAANGELPHPLRIGMLARWRVGTLRDFLRSATTEGASHG